jgi:hypothetical protein
VLLLLAALGLGVREMYRRVDWYQYKPTRWDMRDLESTDPAVSDRAWQELWRQRFEQGKLSRHWQEKMADVALEQHWMAPRRRRGEERMVFLWQQHEAGKLTPAQVDRLFRQTVRVRWTLRPVVLVGQDVPYYAEGERYLPDKGWWMKMGPIEDPHGTPEIPGGTPWGESFAQFYRLSGSAKQTPGEHEMEVRYFTAFYAERSGSERPVWEGIDVHRGKVKVLEKPTDEYLKVVDAPELAEEIKASLKIKRFGGYVGISTTGPPINVAFRVWARINGKEHWVTDVAFKKGVREGMGGSGILTELFKLKNVDLIFRSSEEVAGKTVDLMEMWKGEVVFEGVELKNPKE